MAFRNMIPTKAHRELNIPQEFMTIFPTASGRYSFRMGHGGSWLEEGMKIVATQIKNERKDESMINLLTFITKVSNYVSQRETANSCGEDTVEPGLKNTVTVICKLTNPVFFKIKRS